MNGSTQELCSVRPSDVLTAFRSSAGRMGVSPFARCRELRDVAGDRVVQRQCARCQATNAARLGNRSDQEDGIGVRRQSIVASHRIRSSAPALRWWCGRRPGRSPAGHADPTARPVLRRRCRVLIRRRRVRPCSLGGVSIGVTHAQTGSPRTGRPGIASDWSWPSRTTTVPPTSS